VQLGEEVDGLIVLFDLEHVGMHNLWKPGQFFVTCYQLLVLLRMIVNITLFSR